MHLKKIKIPWAELSKKENIASPSQELVNGIKSSQLDPLKSPPETGQGVNLSKPLDPATQARK